MPHNLAGSLAVLQIVISHKTNPKVNQNQTYVSTTLYLLSWSWFQWPRTGSSRDLHPDSSSGYPTLHRPEHVVAGRSQLSIRRSGGFHGEGALCCCSSDGLCHLELHQPLPHGVRMRDEGRTRHVQFKVSYTLRCFECDFECVAVADCARGVRDGGPLVVVSEEEGENIRNRLW